MKKLLLLLILAIVAGGATPTIIFAGLGNQPVVFKSNGWSVVRGKDAMTDKPTCTGLYKSRFDIQVGAEKFYITLRGRGGVSSYMLRFNDESPLELRLASDLEKNGSTIIVEDADFKKLLSSKRLRVRILTVLDSLIDEDINLTGLENMHKFLIGPECKTD